MTRMVVVHGRGDEHANPDAMLKDIREAFVPTLHDAGVDVQDDDITLAFYGDLFLAAGKGKSLRARAHVARTAKIARELAKTHPAPQPKAPRLLKPITDRPWWRPITGAMDTLITALDHTIVFAWLFFYFMMGDVALYLDDAALRTAVVGRVRAAVSAAAAEGEEVLLIGYSLGSIPSFEALQESRDLPVRQLVTLGSPLGSATIQDTIRHDVPLAFPSQLDAWSNISFENDYVASVHDFSADFPSKDGKRIENIDASRDDGHDWLPWLRHDLDDYLSASDTAKAIAALLR